MSEKPKPQEFVFALIEVLPIGKQEGALTVRESLILSYIGMRANHHGTCYPNNKTIARQTQSGLSTVSRALNKFERMGVIRRETKMRQGRGRMADTIVLNLAEKGQQDAVLPADQHAVLTAARCRSAMQQDAVLPPPTSNRKGQQGKDNVNNSAAIDKIVVNAVAVTEEEMGLAKAAIAAFNKHNPSDTELGLLGTDGTANENLKRIVMRLRETPGLTAAKLREIVGKCFSNPYWSGPARVGNIFGPKAWQGSLVNDGVPRSSRNVRRGIDRKGPQRKGPDW